MRMQMEHIMNMFLPVFELTWNIELRIGHMPDVYGYYEEDDDDDCKPMHTILCSHAHCKTMQDITETIVHELVHAWQNENGHPVKHGRSFRQWAGYIKLQYGIKI